MKPKTITAELTEANIKHLIEEWARGTFRDATDPVVTLTTHEYGDRYDNVIGCTWSASVRMTLKEE